MGVRNGPLEPKYDGSQKGYRRVRNGTKFNEIQKGSRGIRNERGFHRYSAIENQLEAINYYYIIDKIEQGIEYIL